MTAACESCRNLKMRCTRSDTEGRSNDNEAPCDRCKRHNRPCKVPVPRPAGRKPGSRGRYQGVEKAVRKIQSELRKAKAFPMSNGEPAQNITELANGSEEFLGRILSNTNTSCQSQTTETSQGFLQTSPNPSPTSMANAYRPAPHSVLRPIAQSPSEARSPHQGSESVTNPLGLVADACDEAQTFNQPSNATVTSIPTNSESFVLLPSRTGEAEASNRALQLLSRPGYVSLGLKLDRPILEQSLGILLTRELPICEFSGYFKTSDAGKDRDTGPDLDPIDLGLLSMEEAQHLFELFFARLHPINGILDPNLHTPVFVRRQSALLFTWILAISAQFDHGSGLLAKRLRIHGEHLSKHVHSNGYKSVEITQGYYISLLSSTPANTMSEERSWLYTNYAFGVAAELGLDRQPRSKYLPTSGSKRVSSPLVQRLADESVGAAEQLLDMNDSAAVHAERLARNRERTWLRILLWERAHSAARGRVSAFPENDLTLNIEMWHLHPLADPNDKYACGFILLRRHLVVLLDEMQRQQGFHHSSRHWVKELVDGTLNPWCQTWMSGPEVELSPSEHISNTFQKYVYMHGRLWTLSFALHGHVQACTADDSSSGFDAIKEDCFEAAVNCCETAVRDLTEIGEPIYPMLAPTWAMISYAAVLALRLFPLLYGNRPGAEVELLALLAQVALLLEKVGTTPSHHFGIAALLGQHLFMILRTRAGGLKGETEAGGPSQDPNQTQIPVAENADFDSLGPHQNDTQLAFDPLLSGFDSYLTMPFFPGDEGNSNDGFTEVLWDWVGQGFGSIG